MRGGSLIPHVLLPLLDYRSRLVRRRADRSNSPLSHELPVQHVTSGAAVVVPELTILRLEAGNHVPLRRRATVSKARLCHRQLPPQSASQASRAALKQKLLPWTCVQCLRRHTLVLILELNLASRVSFCINSPASDRTLRITLASQLFA